MNNTTIKYELQNILSGKSAVSNGESIQTITRYLRESRGTSEKNKGDESSKSEETKKLIYTQSIIWFAENNPQLSKAARADNYLFWLFFYFIENYLNISFASKVY
jgi:hypothetical protein